MEKLKETTENPSDDASQQIAESSVNKFMSEEEIKSVLNEEPEFSEKEMGELLKEQQKEALTYLSSRPSFKVNQKKNVNEKANSDVS